MIEELLETVGILQETLLDQRRATCTTCFHSARSNIKDYRKKTLCKNAGYSCQGPGELHKKCQRDTGWAPGIQGIENKEFYDPVQLRSNLTPVIGFMCCCASHIKQLFAFPTSINPAAQFTNALHMQCFLLWCIICCPLICLRIDFSNRSLLHRSAEYTVLILALYCKSQITNDFFCFG